MKQTYLRKKRAPTGEMCLYNMCNGTSDYPVDTIKKIIEKNRFISNDFGEVVAPVMIPSDKFDSEGESKNMCETNSFTFYPQTAVNIFQEMAMIVNVEGYKQAVKFEACV